MEYRHVLSKTEKQRHFIYILSKHMEMFPQKGENFPLIVNGNEFLVSIDDQNRIWGGNFTHCFDFNEISTVLIKKEDSKFFLSAIDVPE